MLLSAGQLHRLMDSSKVRLLTKIIAKGEMAGNVRSLAMQLHQPTTAFPFILREIPPTGQAIFAHPR